MIRSAKINHVRAQKSPHLSTLLSHNSHVGYGNKMKVTSRNYAEMHGESFKAYRMEMCYLQQEILLNI